MTGLRRFFCGLVFPLLVVGQMVYADAPLISPRPEARPSGGTRVVVPSLAETIARAELSGAVSVALVDLGTGKLIESHEGRRELPPASVTKVFTALYALEKLGGGHRFQTEVRALGAVRNGVVQGDILLKGGGDPTLDTDDIAGLVAAIKAKGITGATGGVVFDGSALPRIDTIDPGQPDHVGYSPAIYGLNLNYNRVHFEWKRQSGRYTTLMDARTRNRAPQVGFTKMQIVERDRPVYGYKDQGAGSTWTVSRAALGNGGARWLPVRKPGRYAADVFHRLATASNLRFAKAPRPAKGRSQGALLATTASDPLQTLMRQMLLHSTNLTAEIAGLSASAAAGTRATRLKASSGAMTRWAKTRYGMRSAGFVDHSGLGSGSKLSAVEMTQALASAYRQAPIFDLMKKIPLRTAKGKRLQNQPALVRAKTGTLNFASALAGYIRLDDGRTYAFAIFSADTTKRRSIARSDREAPRGGSAWGKKARRLQNALLLRWITRLEG